MGRRVGLGGLTSLLLLPDQVRLAATTGVLRMVLTVSACQGQHQLVGDWPELEVANAFLDHLRIRGFSPATRRAYAFDLLNFGRFLLQLGRPLRSVSAMDVVTWVDWQSQPSAAPPGKVVTLLEGLLHERWTVPRLA